MSTTVPLPIDQQASPVSIGSGHGSIGPVIAVLVVIVVLGVVAGMIGRVCSGRTITGGYTQYDIESWAEAKCSTCIDGTISISPPPPTTTNVSGSSTPLSLPPRTKQHATAADVDS